MAAQVGLAASLPITGTFALPFGLYYTFLTARVIRQRVQAKAAIAQTSSHNPETDPLLASIRAQGNFVENVPLALIFAGVVESNGGSKKALVVALAGLLAARVAHAEFGLMGNKYQGKGRPIGFVGTAVVLNGLALWSAWLVKGYWGF